MSTGTQALQDMDARINAQRAEADRVARRLDALLSIQQTARTQEHASTERLARLRLDLLQQGEAGDKLDLADQRVLSLVAKRHDAFMALDQRIASSGIRQNDLAQVRLDCVKRRDQALGEEQSLFVRAAETSRTDPLWIGASERVTALEQQIAAAETKCQTAEGDREQKRKPYEADKLFVYLWQRRYGFPEYDAMPLIRTMDGWVARLCRYDGAHRNYRMLLALAVQLRAHADTLKARLPEARAELARIEREALDRVGYGELEARRAQAEQALVAAEQALALEEQGHQLNLQQRAAFADGSDPFTVEAVQTLTTHMGREDLQTLRDDARSTSTPKDDALVAGLANARAQISQHDTEIAQLRTQQAALVKQLGDAEELRRRFRSHSYDSRDSEFGNGIVIGAVLGELLRGGILLNDAWDRVHSNHRFRLPRGESGGYGGSDHGGFGGVFGGSGSSGSSDNDSGGFSTDSSFGGDSGGFSSDDSF